MPFNSCPNCGAPISDPDGACPRCGYSLCRTDTKVGFLKPRKLGDLVQNKLGGTIELVLGILAICLGVPLLFTALPIGLILLVGGIVMTVSGYRHVSFKYVVQCPFCGHSAMMFQKKTAYRCPKCRKISYKKNDHLYPQNGI